MPLAKIHVVEGRYPQLRMRHSQMAKRSLGAPLRCILDLTFIEGRSLISKATRVIMLASFSVMTMTRMEVAVADPIVTQQMFQVEHVKIKSTKKFAEVEAALDAGIPQLDPAIGAALTNGEEKRAKELEGGAELFIFLQQLILGNGQTSAKTFGHN
jgi:hypothetical protein